MICEGSDGGGKSTLVEQLVGEYHTWCPSKGVTTPHVTTIHKGPPKPGTDALDEYLVPLSEAPLRDRIGSPYELVVMDRWHLGEVVYGPLLRGKSRLSPPQLTHLELALEAMGAAKLLVQPQDPVELELRFKQRGDDLVRLEQLRQVHDEYEGLAELYGYHRATLYTPMEVLRYAHRLQFNRHGSPTAAWPGYVGNPWPRYLLVGDRRNDGPMWDDRDLTWAFLPSLATSASTHLMRALVASLVNLGHVGIVNANEDDVDLTRVHQLQLHAQTSVTALGNEASAALKAAEVEHVRVPHPQWARRFRAHQLDEYAQQIREAMGGDRSRDRAGGVPRSDGGVAG